jgi:tRNA pseudouridine38-40 synthase
VTTYRLDLAYDGAGFHGYARQQSVRTIQGELEAALEPFTGPVETFVAGRTDRGVHAAAQVVSFTVAAPIDTSSVARSLNRRLGPEIAVKRLAEAPEGFHARFSAVGRAYEYQVLDSEAPDPFLARVSWHVSQPLDVAAMDAAASHLLGEHDFAAFCKRREGATTVRALQRLDWARGPDGVVVVAVSADAFCHSMVRSLVGAMLDVGRGRRAVDWPAGLLARGERASDVGVAPAHGLTLVGVDYPPDDELAARAAVTRRVRGTPS